MLERADRLGAAAAGVVALAAALGGAFAPGQRLAVGLLVAGLAAWAAATWRGTLAREEWAGLGVLCWACAAALLVASYPFAAREMIGGWLVAWLLWVVAARAGAVGQRTMLSLVTAAAGLVAAAVLLESIGAGEPRVGGFFVNPNVAVALLVPSIPAIWSNADGRSRPWTVAITVLLVAGVVMTSSRAGLLALVVVAGLMLPAGRPRAVGVAVAATLAGALLTWRFLLHPDSLAWHRIEIWRALWRLVAEHPLTGVGPGWLEEATGPVRIAHGEPIARFQHVIGSAESTPVGLLVRIGWPGLALAVIAVVQWLRRARREGRLALPPVAATAAAMALLAGFHDSLDLYVVLWWWAVLLGVASPMPARGRAGEVAAPPAMMRAVAALAIAGLLLWAVAQSALARYLWWSRPSTPQLVERVARVDPLLSEPAEWRSRSLLTLPSWGWPEAVEAIRSSEGAVALHPGSARAWSVSAQVHARVAGDLGAWPDSMEGARTGFERATALEPHLPWYWLQWARFERAAGDLEAARRLAARALAEEPNFVRGLLFAARLELDRGQVGAARRAFDRAEGARSLARGRLLTSYERDLLRSSTWQVEEIRQALAQAVN